MRRLAHVPGVEVHIPQGDGPPRVAPAARDSLPSLQRSLWAEVSDRRPAGDGSGNHRHSFIPDQVFRCGPTWDGTRYRNTRKWQPAHRNPEYLWGARAAGYKLLVQNIESSWTRETFGTLAMERGVPLPSDFAWIVAKSPSPKGGKGKRGGGVGSRTGGASALFTFQATDDAHLARKRLWTLWSRHTEHGAGWAWLQIRFLEAMEMGNSLSPSSTQRGSVEAFAHPDPQIQRWWRPASHLYADWMIDEEGDFPEAAVA